MKTAVIYYLIALGVIAGVVGMALEPVGTTLSTIWFNGDSWLRLAVCAGCGFAVVIVVAKPVKTRLFSKNRSGNTGNP